MTAQVLIVIGGAIFALLGTLHLLYTFFTDKFDARDCSVTTAMQGTSPVITGRTTMWQAWIGFNASHSLGAMVFGLLYILLAVGHMDLLTGSPVFVLVALANGLAWLGLARAYWFRTPLVGIAIATACFAAALVLIWIA